MGKRFGNAIPGSVKPVPLPSKYQPAVPPVKMPIHQQDTSDIKPAPMPMYPGQSTDRMPVHKDDKFVIPQEMYQEGGNLPSDDQQQSNIKSEIDRKRDWRCGTGQWNCQTPGF